jgi:hypothetical protein
VLRARECALRALLTSHTALLNVTQPLRQRMGGGNDSGGAALATWQAQLRQLEQLTSANAATKGLANGNGQSAAINRAAATAAAAAAVANGALVGGPNGALAAAAAAAFAPPPNGVSAAAPPNGALAAAAAAAFAPPPNGAAAAAGALPSWARKVQDMIREEGEDALLQRYSGFTGKDMADVFRTYSQEVASSLFRCVCGGGCRGVFWCSGRCNEGSG